MISSAGGSYRLLISLLCSENIRMDVSYHGLDCHSRQHDAGPCLNFLCPLWIEYL